ncbi:MAG: acyltransferase [Alphaproteobacteria bacterium]
MGPAETPSGIQPLPSLQAGRAFAALAVLAFHVSGLLELPKYGATHFARSWLISGGLGVDFFFILSGFIILHAHIGDIGKPQAFGRYLWRRFSRIYPIYWIYLNLALAAFLAFGHRYGWQEILSNYTLLGPRPATSILAPAGTLYHEVTFYILFAFGILNRKLGAAVLALWLAAILFIHHDNPFTSMRDLEFILGMAVRAITFHIPARHYRLPLITGAALAALTLWINHTDMTTSPRITGLVEAASAFFILGCALADRARAWSVPKLLQYLGDASYTLYLTHLAFLSLFLKILSLTGFLATAPLSITIVGLMLIATLGAAVLYSALEKPLLRRIRGKR